jgi:hypothetical protein
MTTITTPTSPFPVGKFPTNTGPFPHPQPVPITPRASTAGTLAGLTGDQQNAYTALQSLLAAYGLESLAPTILGYVKQNYDVPTASYLLTQTNEWKQRFAGNEILKKRGLAELEPAAYLDLESRYAQVLKQAGIPEGQYGRSDFANWIGNSVAPTEIQDRVQMAASAVQNSDPYFKSALHAMGIDTGHLTAYYLDQSRAEPFLTHQFNAAQIGAEALRNNLRFDPSTAMQLASMGLSQSQAAQGYSDIAKMLPRLNQLSQITPGAAFTQSTAEKDLLFGNADAARQAQNLMLQEQSRFSGSGGVGDNLYHPIYGVQPALQGSY